jgi:hypothetical protein
MEKDLTTPGGGKHNTIKDLFTPAGVLRMTLMNRKRSLVGLGLLLLTIGAPLEGAKVKVWQHTNQGHFEKAKFKNAVVSSEGRLRLSRQVKTLANIDATHVWDVLEDKVGNLIVATGPEGKIFKVAADGKVDLLYSSSDSQILCMAHGPDGTIFAGTGPQGTVLRIAADKTGVFVEDLDSYVWDLAYDPQTKVLFAGTGPRGRIFQIQPEGKATVFYATKQEHILRLALGAKGNLFAGTDKGGMVYRIDARGKGFVIFHTPQGEIRSLRVTEDAVYAGTGSPVTRRSSGSGTKTSGSSAPSETSPVAQVSGSTKETKTAQPAAEIKPASSTGSDETRIAGAAPAPSQPTVGENSLFRIAHDGTVRELFREKVLILSMLKLNGRFLLGTGMQGQLIEVDEQSKEKTEIARLDHGQIHCLLQRRDGSIVLSTGDPGKLYVLEDRFVAQGTVTSEVLDAKIISKWGALSWKTGNLPGTSVSCAVRSGNVPEPDDTWSDWSAEQTDPHMSKVQAPTARYLQYRLTLKSENPKATPEVRGVALRYQTTNQAPEITTFEVPDIDGASLENPRKLKLKWAAVDANEDELTYHLFFKKDGWKDWVLLEEDLEKKDYEWDTTAVPTGTYQLKVVASDRHDNAAEDALTAERLSTPVPVAHDPPKVTVKVSGIEADQAVIEGSATDPLVRLTEASFALNGKRWTNVFPTDGLFDSKSEDFRFKTETLRPGTYVLRLRVRDAVGNVGAGDAVFTVQAKGK